MLVETLPVGADTAQWPAWGTTAEIVVTDAGRLAEATALVRAEFAAVEAARRELREVGRSGGRPVFVSPLLAHLVAVALDAARNTDGAVDPTVGGYDRAFAALTGRPAAPAVRVFDAPDWRAVQLRVRELTLPDGVRLDLGATAPAAAADRAAATVAAELGIGVLVAIGGDIATAGIAPPGGWQVVVPEPSCLIRLPAGVALSTSGNAGVVDPGTGRPAPPVWLSASVAAFSCVRASALSTAAIVRGFGAPELLDRIPARLVTPALEVLKLGGWPGYGAR